MISGRATRVLLFGLLSPGKLALALGHRYPPLFAAFVLTCTLPSFARLAFGRVSATLTSGSSCLCGALLPAAARNHARTSPACHSAPSAVSLRRTWPHHVSVCVCAVFRVFSCWTALRARRRYANVLRCPPALPADRPPPRTFTHAPQPHHPVANVPAATYPITTLPSSRRLSLRVLPYRALNGLLLHRAVCSVACLETWFGTLLPSLPLFSWIPACILVRKQKRLWIFDAWAVADGGSVCACVSLCRRFHFYTRLNCYSGMDICQQRLPSGEISAVSFIKRVVWQHIYAAAVSIDNICRLATWRLDLLYFPLCACLHNCHQRPAPLPWGMFFMRHIRGERGHGTHGCSGDAPPVWFGRDARYARSRPGALFWFQHAVRHLSLPPPVWAPCTSSL